MGSEMCIRDRFNVSRGALAVVALTQRPDLLIPATEDMLHQGQRASALPGATELIASLRSRGIAAVLSGAGPTVLALCTEPFPQDLKDKAVADGLRVLELDVADGVSTS